MSSPQQPYGDFGFEENFGETNYNNQFSPNSQYPNYDSNGYQSAPYVQGFTGDMPKNTWAIWGLVLGIAALVLAILVFTSPLGVLIGIGGLILSIIALVKAKNYPPVTARKGMSITGLVLSILGVLGGIILSIVFFAIVSTGIDAAVKCEELTDGSEEAMDQCIDGYLDEFVENI